MNRGIAAPVGSSAGQAFIYDRSDLSLPDPKAPLLFDKYMAQAKKARLAEKKKKAEAGDKLKTFLDESGEYWYRHNSEMQGSMDELSNMGAELLANGVDPFTANDPASQSFRKKKDKIEKMSNYSTQMKELHGEYFKKMTDGKDGRSPKYTQESMNAVADYFERPLTEIIQSNEEPPRLELANPAFSILKYDTDVAKDILAAKKDGVEDREVVDFAIKSLEDPEVNDAVFAQIEKMGDVGRKALTAMAQNEGMSPEIYLRYQQMLPHFRGPEDNFDFTKVEAQMKAGSSSSIVEQGDVTTSVTRLNPKRAEEAARLIVTANPKYVQNGVKAGRFGSTGNTFDQNMAAAIEWNKKRLLSAAENKYSKTEDEDDRFGGYSRATYMSNRTKWLEAVRRGDVDIAREAGDYLKGVKLEDGSVVESVDLASGSGPGPDTEGNVISLTTVRTYKDDGEVKVERNRVPINRSEDTDEFLLRLHDQAFAGPGKKQMFGQTERSGKEVPAYAPGKPMTETEDVPAYLKILE